MKKHLLLLFGFMAGLCSFCQTRYQVVISEIMADPSPTVGLPNNEWVELKNTGTTAVNLAGWRIGDVAGISGPMPNFTLAPNAYVVVCTGSAVTALSAFGPVIPVTSFPSLGNDSDEIFLLSASGINMHAVSYKDSWYNNELKKEGGWTLEMIDPLQPCAGKENWTASTDNRGGTPGTVNSVNGVLTNIVLLTATHTYSTSQTITVMFNQPVDSTIAANPANYSLPGYTIILATPVPPLFNRVQLSLNTPLAEETVYTLLVQPLAGCNGTLMAAQQLPVGLSSAPAIKDLVINEILFRPRSGGYDYVELLNTSRKIVDLSGLSLSNRNTAGNIANIRSLHPTPVYIYPGAYVVITENAASLGLQYLVKHPEKVYEIPALPSYPNVSGHVVLLNSQGLIIDEVGYSSKWHFPLIDNDEGIALERIDPAGASQDAANWHSAASTAGFGTPTYQNSQYKIPGESKGSITIVPSVFSPDGDGFNDIASIHYQLPENGFVANITIFDAAGRPVKKLVSNETTTTAGYWNWNGLDDKNSALPIGTYVVLSEFFNLQGKKYRYKNTLTLARRL